MNQNHMIHGYLSELLPSYYNGYDAADFKAFIYRFEAFCAFHSIEDDRKCALFSGLLSDNALYFYIDLPSDTQNNWTRLSDAFQHKFGPGGVSSIVKFNSTFLKQKDDESLEHYVHRYHFAASKYGLSQTEKWKFFTHGLKHPLRGYVALKEPTNIDEAERYAKHGEAFYKEIKDSPQFCHAAGFPCEIKENVRKSTAVDTNISENRPVNCSITAAEYDRTDPRTAVNNCAGSDLHPPRGGYKQSPYGYRRSYHAINKFHRSSDNNYDHRKFSSGHTGCSARRRRARYAKIDSGASRPFMAQNMDCL